MLVKTGYHSGPVTVVAVIVTVASLPDYKQENREVRWSKGIVRGEYGSLAFFRLSRVKYGWSTGRVRMEYEWSTVEYEWSISGVEWSISGVEWSTSGVRVE